MENGNRYVGFTTGDFVCDEMFQEWVLHPGTEKDVFWLQWLSQNPDHREQVEQARILIQQLRFVEHVPKEEQVQQALDNMLEKIEYQHTNTRPRLGVLYFIMGQLARINAAAAITGLIMLASITGYFLYRNFAEEIVTTDYAQLHTVYLPDSSVVILNAKSSINYKKYWPAAGVPREVWLEGEAFFNVRHINRDTTHLLPNERFLVHTNEFTVEVLGTSFDIRLRRGKTEIALLSGKIKVHFNDGSAPDIIMAPGDLFAYNPVGRQINRSATLPENYSSWTEKKFMSSDATVNEIVEYIEDNFGCKIILENQQMGARKIEGPIMLDNLEDAMFVLHSLVKADILNKGDTLILKTK